MKLYNPYLQIVINDIKNHTHLTRREKQNLAYNYINSTFPVSYSESLYSDMSLDQVETLHTEHNFAGVDFEPNPSDRSFDQLEKVHIEHNFMCADFEPTWGTVTPDTIRRDSPVAVMFFINLLFTYSHFNNLKSLQSIDDKTNNDPERLFGKRVFTIDGGNSREHKRLLSTNNLVKTKDSSINPNLVSLNSISVPKDVFELVSKKLDPYQFAFDHTWEAPEIFNAGQIALNLRLEPKSMIQDLQIIQDLEEYFFDFGNPDTVKYMKNFTGLDLDTIASNRNHKTGKSIADLTNSEDFQSLWDTNFSGKQETASGKSLYKIYEKLPELSDMFAKVSRVFDGQNQLSTLQNNTIINYYKKQTLYPAYRVQERKDTVELLKAGNKLIILGSLLERIGFKLGFGDTEHVLTREELRFVLPEKDFDIVLKYYMDAKYLLQISMQNYLSENFTSDLY